MRQLDIADVVELQGVAAGRGQGHLDRAIRAIIGLDSETVRSRFTEFVGRHPELNSHQVKFLDLLQNHIARYGSIEVGDLYESPFTLLHSDGLDGVFDEPLAEELLQVIGSFVPLGNAATEPSAPEG